MVISHSGVDVDTQKDPIGAIKLCLNAASGCSAKGRAWGWADDALNIVGSSFPNHYEKFKELLGGGRYPECSFSLEFLK